MSNRKKTRMDAIERRLAVLEARTIPPAEPLRRGTVAGEAEHLRRMMSTPGPLLDDVRERVSERSALADATADGPLWGSSEHFQSLVTRHCAAHKTLDRYEASLRALQGMLLLGSDPSSADLYALVTGCLNGGTITSDGLQRAE